MISYVVSFLSGFAFFFATDPYLIMVFMIIDRYNRFCCHYAHINFDCFSITVHSAAPLFNIIISDFIDDDAKRHFRK